jgi:glycosyltransferase involved in cell wall biosynthesis
MKKKIKVLHWVGVTPNACGLYEHAKDEVKVERSVGIDAQVIDFRIAKDKNGVEFEDFGSPKTDEWLTTVGKEWVDKADIQVIHSGIPETYKQKAPCILIMHGRPEYGFQLALRAGRSAYQDYMQIRWDERYKKFMYFWPEHQFHLELAFPPHKLAYIPPFIDTDRFNPTGDKYDFLTYGGEPNILVADVWREDYTPFNTTLAVAKFIKDSCPKAKLHVFGTPFEKPAMQGHFGMLKDSGYLGSAGGMTAKMDKIYRACDILVSPTVIANRVVREAQSCGCVVVANTGATFTEFTGSDRDIHGFSQSINKAYEYWKADKSKARMDSYNTAQNLFGAKQGGEALLTLYKEILKGEK